jgi:hypothetical protein
MQRRRRQRPIDDLLRHRHDVGQMCRSAKTLGMDPVDLPRCPTSARQTGGVGPKATCLVVQAPGLRSYDLLYLVRADVATNISS